MIIVCASCGAKNRVPEEKTSGATKLWAMSSAITTACTY